MLNMCLALERWFAVVKPIQYRYKFCKTRVYVYIFLLTIVLSAISVGTHGMLPSFHLKSTYSETFCYNEFHVDTDFALLVILGYVYLFMAAF